MKDKVQIRKLNSEDITSIEEIFFLTTSRKTFANDTEKKEFFKSWTSYYLEQCADEVYLAITPEGQAAAYLTGCSNSMRAVDFLAPKIPSYTLFEDLFEEYPAHLHINTHPDFQGHGLGGQLIEHYINVLKENGVKGLHIITAGDSRNIGFYHKHGFTEEVERIFKGSRLRFMGLKM